MWISRNKADPLSLQPGAKRSGKRGADIVMALAGLGLLALSGCSTAYTPRSDGWCYWPDPLYRDCREIVEFNHWR